MKKRIFSGIQPSGNLHIGNYLGAIKQFVELQNEHEAFFCIVDQHAITVAQDPKELRENTLAVATAYMAAGIDPSKSTIFLQSHVPAHTELGWILNTMTTLGQLEQMTQFKDKIGSKYSQIIADKGYAETMEEMGDDFAVSYNLSNKDQLEDVVKERHKRRLSAPMGLFSYPTLMAADILLYQTHEVPVGEDQVQHIELTRSLAKRFNNKYGEAFVVPKVVLNKESARIMALDEPTKKMSKSAASASGYIALCDDADTIRQKFQSAMTDSESEVRYDPAAKPGISNLLNIAAGFSNKTIEETQAQFAGVSYAEFKQAVAELVIEGITPFQNAYIELEKTPDTVTAALREGGEHARSVAQKTLADVTEKMGFLSI